MMFEPWESAADHQRKEWLHLFFCVFDVLLVFSGFGGGRTRVSGGTVDSTTPPSTSLVPSLSLTLALSLPLSAVPNHCLYSCLSPLQQKPFSGESQTHTFTHKHARFLPRVIHGAKGHDPGSITGSSSVKTFFSLINYQRSKERASFCRPGILTG